MKKAAKHLLHRTGLLSLAQPLYFDLKLARPELLRRELQYRLHGAPDGLPLPDGRRIFDVIACHWQAAYYESGRQIVNDMIAILRRHDVDAAAFEAVLDFGCGCGRLLRHLASHTDAALYGSDYNPDLVDWCRQHLPLATFDANALHPPLPDDDASFDCIYARSVFTHLPEQLQHDWMRELHRVLRPSGVLYLTMHGRPLLGGLSTKQRRAFEDDRLVVTYSTLAGDDLCSTYASEGYVDRHLTDGFERIAFVESRSEPHLRQDVHLLRRA